MSKIIPVSPLYLLDLYYSNYKELVIYYPNKSSESFPLVKPLKSNEFEPISDLMDTLNHISFEIKEAKTIVSQMNELLLNFNDGHFDSVYKLSIALNEIILSNSRINADSSDNLISHLINQSYNRIIDKPSLLNKYKNFSHEVYGEANSSFIDLLTRTANIKPNHVFVDMGLGIGTVVIQIAAKAKCKCYGIELRTLPSAYAKVLSLEFESRMKCFNKDIGLIYLKQGNFLLDEQFLSIIQQADVIFANNVAFGPEINSKLLDLFICLKDNTKIISLVNFAPIDLNIRQFNINSPMCIFQVEKFEYPPGSMSWTSSAGNFYVHTINRERLKSFQ